MNTYKLKDGTLKVLAERYDMGATEGYNVQ